MTDKFKGFELFNDIEDEVLRTRNRAVVIANLFEDNSKNAKVTPKGAALILGYFKLIPEGERKAVEAKFVESMRERGFRVGA